jgi:hypothetical protein
MAERIRSQVSPAELAANLDGVERGPAIGLEIALVPQRLTTRGRGRLRVRLTNTGNADQAIDLAVADPEAALAARLDADRIAVPAGERREVALGLRPRKRPLFAPPRRFPFTVTAFPAGVGAAEPLGQAEGELISQAPLAAVVIILSGARRLAFGLVAVMLAAAAAVWMLASPGAPSAPGTRGAKLLPAAGTHAADGRAASGHRAGGREELRAWCAWCAGGGQHPHRCRCD